MDHSRVDLRYVTQTSYWPSGGITSLTRGNNLVHTETYNSVLQLSGVTETASGVPLLNFVFNWNAPQTLFDNGTLQSMTTTAAAWPQRKRSAMTV